MRRRRVFWRIYGMKYSWKSHKDRDRHKNRLKGVGKLGWFMSKTQTATSPPRGGEPTGTYRRRDSCKDNTCNSSSSNSSCSGNSSWFVSQWTDIQRPVNGESHIRAKRKFLITWESGQGSWRTTLHPDRVCGNEVEWTRKAENRMTYFLAIDEAWKAV